MQDIEVKKIREGLGEAGNNYNVHIKVVRT